MTVNHSVRSFLQLKNDINTARWRMRMAVTGGHDMADMRNWKQLEQYRVIRFAVWKAQDTLKAARRIACGEFLRRTPALLRRQAE